MSKPQSSPLTIGWGLAALVSVVVAAIGTWDVFAAQSALSARRAELQDAVSLVRKIEGLGGQLQNVPIDATVMENLLQSALSDVELKIVTGRKRDIAATALVSRPVTISLGRAALSDVVTALKLAEKEWPALQISSIQMNEPSRIQPGGAELWDAEVVLTQVGDNTISSGW